MTGSKDALLFSRLSRHFHTEYSRHFELNDLLTSVGRILVNTLADRKPQLADLSLYQIIVTANLYKALECSWSIQSLLDSGFVGDARALCRKLLELMLNISYLAQDRGNREQLYWHFVGTSLAKDLRRVTTRPDQYSDVIREGMEKIRDEIEAAERESRKHWTFKQTGGPAGEFKKYWAGIGPEQMAKETGLSWVYSFPYMLFSRSVHSSMDDLTSYFDPEAPCFGPQHDPAEVPWLLHECFRALWQILSICVDAYELQFRGSLSTLWQRSLTLMDADVASLHSRAERPTE